MKNKKNKKLHLVLFPNRKALLNNYLRYLPKGDWNIKKEVGIPKEIETDDIRIVLRAIEEPELYRGIKPEELTVDEMPKVIPDEVLMLMNAIDNKD